MTRQWEGAEHQFGLVSLKSQCNNVVSWVMPHPWGCCPFLRGSRDLADFLTLAQLHPLEEGISLAPIHFISCLALSFILYAALCNISSISGSSVSGGWIAMSCSNTSRHWLYNKTEATGLIYLQAFPQQQTQRLPKRSTSSRAWHRHQSRNATPWSRLQSTCLGKGIRVTTLQFKGGKRT